MCGVGFCGEEGHVQRPLDLFLSLCSEITADCALEAIRGVSDITGVSPHARLA